MTSIYHGWTPEPSERQKLDNEIASCLSFLAENPLQPYWSARLATCLDKLATMDTPTPAAPVTGDYDLPPVVEQPVIKWDDIPEIPFGN